MIKEYRSNMVLVLIALLGSSIATHVHSEPGVAERYHAENIRKVAVITNDASQLPEPIGNYRHEDSFPSTLKLESDDRFARINIQYKFVEGPASSMYPRFKVTNIGDNDLDLAGLALHYWFNCDCATTTAELEGVVNWAGFMPSGLSITSRLRVSFEPASSGRQTHVMVVRFVNDSPALLPGQSVEIHTRFNRKDWGNMPPINDWSYAPFDTFTGWNRIAGYVNGSRVWGREP